MNFLTKLPPRALGILAWLCAPVALCLYIGILARAAHFALAGF